MIKIWDVTIPELTADETRRAYIYLPDSYKKNPDKRYPVLYMFDGHNVFFDSHATYGKCWGMKEYMDKTKTEMIIAAVECNHSPDHGRLSEYSPYSFTDPDPAFGKITGKGKIYMNWLVNTFKPEIDENYRTLADREHTFIAGSSMGGLMSLYAVLKYNRVFSRAACLSPSVWVAEGKIIQLAAKARLKKDTIIYIDYGYNELRNHFSMQFLISQLTATLINRFVNVTSRIIPNGDHCEASWERQIPFFISALLYGMDSETSEDSELSSEEPEEIISAENPEDFDESKESCAAQKETKTKKKH